MPIDPISLALGALGGKGGSTEVNQSVSQTTSALAALSLSNVVGAGSANGGPLEAPITQTATATAKLPASPAPVYGQTWGPDYSSGDLSAAQAEPIISEAGFSPVLVMAVIGFVGFMLMKGQDD